MLSEKFEKNFIILELPYNIGICTNIAHANSLHPPTNMLLASRLSMSRNTKLYDISYIKKVAQISSATTTTSV